MSIDTVYFPSVWGNIWWGGFKISGTGGFYGGFRGQPPYSITRTNYLFLKTMMPRVLEAELLPRDLIFPDIRGVVLYFFPCKSHERSTENFSSLFELLENEKSMMITSICHMEMLIFTSAQLHPKYREDAARSIGKQFLWGTVRDKIPPNTLCTSPSRIEGSDVLNRDPNTNGTNDDQVTEDEKEPEAR